MGYTCDFCGEQRSTVYCLSDAACLCLSCDRNIHSANALSQHHRRTLVCERCNSQPALTRCVEKNLSLCRKCDWIAENASNSASTHKKQTVNCYSGCPSVVELSKIWSFLLDLPSVVDSTCEQGMGSMSITDNCPKNCQDPQANDNGQDLSVAAAMNVLQSVDNSDIWTGSQTSRVDHQLHNVDQPKNERQKEVQNNDSEQNGVAATSSERISSREETSEKERETNKLSREDPGRHVGKKLDDVSDKRGEQSSVANPSSRQKKTQQSRENGERIQSKRQCNIARETPRT